MKRTTTTLNSPIHPTSSTTTGSPGLTVDGSASPDPLAPTCQWCYIPIGGYPIRDDGTTWHQHCRRAYIEARAAENADRYIDADLGLATALAAIQGRAKVVA